MKKILFPLLVLLAMFCIPVLFYLDLLDNAQLNSALVICTVVWFVGLFLSEKVIQKKDTV